MKRSKQDRRWHASLVRGRRLEFVAYVVAPDRETAEAEVIKEHALSADDQRRLVVREETVRK